MKIFSVLLFSIFMSGCVSGEMVSNIEPGMSSEQVQHVMGKPDGFQKRGNFTIYKYVNRLISGWSWDRTDYSFIFEDDKLVEYGAGEIRERNVGGVQTIFLYKM